MHLQVLVHELGERDRRAPASRPEPVEHLPQRLLRLNARREPTDLRPLRAATLNPVPIRPQRLTVGTLRLQLEHLTLLDHHKPPRSNNGTEESRPDHLSAREGVREDGCPPRRTREMTYVVGADCQTRPLSIVVRGIETPSGTGPCLCGCRDRERRGRGQQQPSAQPSPRQLSRPSLTATAAIARAVSGSAHHQPASAFAPNPRSSAIER